MKVNDKVVNIADCSSVISGTSKRKDLKSGTIGVIKVVTPANNGHLALYDVKFPGHKALISFYDFELVKLRST